MSAETHPRFSLVQRLILAIVPRVVSALVWLSGLTWRFEVLAPEGVTPTVSGEKSPPNIYCFWHQCVLPCTVYFRYSRAVILINVIETGRTAIFTADGPLGPIYQTKMGPIKLAQMTGAPIGAFHLQPEHAWVIGSWDKFLVPKPFTRICVSWGPWTRVPADLAPEDFEPKRQQLNAAIEFARLRSYDYFKKAKP